ncbi:MAG TPA: hypothetical protein VJU81_23790 [Methylomirabilota bacterium]|nr:hypothetical protein [Methylomirabilota bacterium]
MSIAARAAVVEPPSPMWLPTHPRVAELERLGDEIAELAAHLDAATARLLDLIREFDARGGWNTGFRSCAEWLAWRVGMNLGAARERVRVVRALPHHRAHRAPPLAGQAARPRLGARRAASRVESATAGLTLAPSRFRGNVSAETRGRFSRVEPISQRPAGMRESPADGHERPMCRPHGHPDLGGALQGAQRGRPRRPFSFLSVGRPAGSSYTLGKSIPTIDRG